MDEGETGAIFSADRRYRYRLTRRIGDGELAVMFMMLNPSKADETRDDPTIRKCCGFAKRWGFGWMHAVNLSPLMATRPADLAACLPEPACVQDRNKRVIMETVSISDLIVAAYGNAGRLLLVKVEGAQNRIPEVVWPLWDADRYVYCLGLTKLGEPRHPVRAGYDIEPLPFGDAPHWTEQYLRVWEPSME